MIESLLYYLSLMSAVESLLYYMPFMAVVISCFILKYSCDVFEQAAAYLSRNMKPGIKGATINAIGSSMPEMMSCFAILFFYDDPSLFAIALGITAGSGVFNTAVIPSLSILFAKNKDGSALDFITLDRRNIIRDVFWVVLSDVVLIAMIFHGKITIPLAILLNLVYVGYAIHIYFNAKKNGDTEIEDYEDEELEDRGFIGNILTFNFNKLLFKGKPITLRSAIVLLAISVVIITLGSHILVDGVIGSAKILSIPDFISGLILGAAASSIPDLILSLKDSGKGNFEDAVANPLGSNTFDTSISVGLPLLIWFLTKGESSIDIVAQNMDALRISVVAMSASVGLTLIFKYKRITKMTAVFLLFLYAAWCVWIGFTYM